jgi:exportin-1
MQASFRSSPKRGERAIHRRDCSNLEEDNRGPESTASTYLLRSLWTYDQCPRPEAYTGETHCGANVVSQPGSMFLECYSDSAMLMSNAQWDAIISQANNDPTILQDGETIKVVGNIMKTNVAACTSIGSYFYPQIGRIYHDMLSMYRATSQMISDSVTRDGKNSFKAFPR